MKIYTKTGDKGETSLLGGKRLSKNHLRIETYGTVDELNSFTGVLRDHIQNETIENLLLTIQDRLFTIGSILAAAGDTEKFKIPQLHESDIELLENTIDKMNESLEPMRSFILPGGYIPSSFAHVCRTVCRRAERLCVSLQQEDTCPDIIIKYLNRLSDYYFVLSRYLAKTAGKADTNWSPKL